LLSPWPSPLEWARVVFHPKVLFFLTLARLETVSQCYKSLGCHADYYESDERRNGCD
jgi:hypothetical protein